MEVASQRTPRHRTRGHIPIDGHEDARLEKVTRDGTPGPALPEPQTDPMPAPAQHPPKPTPPQASKLLQRQTGLRRPPWPQRFSRHQGRKDDAEGQGIGAAPVIPEVIETDSPPIG